MLVSNTGIRTHGFLYNFRKRALLCKYTRLNEQFIQFDNDDFTQFDTDNIIIKLGELSILCQFLSYYDENRQGINNSPNQI